MRTLCGLSLALLIAGCGPTGEDLVGKAEKLTLIEGLPHPNMDGEAYQQAKAGPRSNADRWGHRFYDDALPIPPEVEAKLRAILGDPSSYKAFSGEKKCGGFHPDFAVEHGTKVDLLCFSCDEVMVGAASRQGDRVGRYDLTQAAAGELETLLRPLARGPKPAGEAAR